MFACGINDIKIGECILFRYPWRMYGTVMVDKIQDRYIYTHENYGKEDNVKIYFPNDYDNIILKIRNEWDNEENYTCNSVELMYNT